jgi:hypothetical protein
VDDLTAVHMATSDVDETTPMHNNLLEMQGAGGWAK